MKKKIGDLFTQTSGKALKKSNQVGTLHRYITTSNLFYGRFDFSEVREMYFSDSEIEKCTAKKGDLLVCNGGDVGRAAVWNYDYDICLQNHVTRLRKISDNLNPFYYYYFFKYIKALNLIEGNGVGIESLSAKTILSIEVPFPPQNEQNQIVKHLDTIQSAIDNKKQQLSLLDEAVKSKFVEMFGSPIDNDKSFPKKRMTDVCPIQEAKLQIVSDSVWLLNLDMIEQDTGTILDKQIVSMDEVGNSTIQFSSDHVLYSKLRPYLNKVALPDEAGYASSELVPFLPKREINKIYFAYLLRSYSFVELINSKSGGAKMPRASMDFIRKFEIPVPPLSLQNQFAAFVQQIDKSKSLVKQQIADLQELLDSKMQEYFA